MPQYVFWDCDLLFGGVCSVVLASRLGFYCARFLFACCIAMVVLMVAMVTTLPLFLALMAEVASGMGAVPIMRHVVP